MYTHVMLSVGIEGKDTPTVVESLAWLCLSCV